MGSEDYERTLGVTEAIKVVTLQCPSAYVRETAEAAMEAIARGGSEVLAQQAYLVQTAIRGWRGERATQVHRSLQSFLEGKTADRDSGAKRSG